LVDCTLANTGLRNGAGRRKTHGRTQTSDRAVALERAAEKYRDIIKDLEDKESQIDCFVEGIWDIVQEEGGDVNG